MNRKLILITLISLLSRNNVLLGFNEKLVTTSTELKTTLIPPGQCYVSLTVNPSSAIFGSLVTFYSTLNCSVVPPFEYLCCYYFWQDNLSDNITVTAGLTTSYLSKIYETKHVKNHKYIMEVRVCWQKTFGELPISDIEYSVCDYSIALNTTTFELTDTLNGILRLEQPRDYPGSSSVLMIGKEAKAVFIPTDQRLEVLTYRWIINGSNYMMTNNSSIQFIPAKVGIISIELHVFDNVSHSTGTFKQFVECKEPILDAFITGKKRLLVEDNGTFVLTYIGSAPFTFCWEVERSGSFHGTDCIYELYNTTGKVTGITSFYIPTGIKSGRQKILGNLTNDVSKKVLTFEINVFARVNISSEVLVIILIVGIFMSALLVKILCRREPERRRRLPVEVADFDFYPGLVPTKVNTLRGRIQQYYDLRILPLLIQLQQMFKSVPQEKHELYTPLNGSCLEERLLSSNTSDSEEHENLQMKSMAPTLESFPRSNYGSL